MKKSKLLRTASAVLVLMIMVFTLSSCTALDVLLGLDTDITTTVNQGGTQDSTVTPPPAGDTIINNVTINGGGGDLSKAANEGLRSIVSIYCTTGTSGAAGSGIIYKVNDEGDAFIITNYHVVYNSSATTTNKIYRDIKLYLYGMEYTEYGITATYVGGSMNYDIAVLRVDDSPILKDAVKNGSAQAVKIADSNKISVGQSTIAIGNPQSQGISVTVGAVSVDSEHITIMGSDGKTEVTFRVIRTDTAVNSGNSGGGFFNTEGELIGVINAKIINSQVENIGYAIPSSVARAIADNIIDYCYGKDCKTVMRGLLGITVIVDEMYTYYDTEEAMLVRCETIKVQDVTSGGLGSGILQSGDIIKSVTIGGDKIEITRQHHLIDAMLDVRVGDTVSMEIVRGGENKTVSTVITQDCLAAY